MQNIVLGLRLSFLRCWGWAGLGWAGIGLDWAELGWAGRMSDPTNERKKEQTQKPVSERGRVGSGLNRHAHWAGLGWDWNGLGWAGLGG